MSELRVERFLLDRIAEDEARAGRPTYRMPQDSPIAWSRTHSWSDDEPTMVSYQKYGDRGETELPWEDFAREFMAASQSDESKRTLAECRAKRAVMETLVSMAGHTWQVENAMRAMARVYASHPDFDHEWVDNVD